MVILVAALFFVQSITVTIAVPPKSGPVVYSFSSVAPGFPIRAKQVSLDSSVQLGPDNDAIFARAVPPRNPGYWIQAIRPTVTVFGTTRDLWCVPGAANSRPIATFQYLDWLQGDEGTSSYLALLALVVTPAPSLPIATNVVAAGDYVWISSDSFYCGGQPSIAFFDLTRSRFSVFLFVLTI